MSAEAPRFKDVKRRLLLKTYPLEYQPSPRLSFFEELVGNERLKEVKKADSWIHGLGATVQMGSRTRISYFDTYGLKVDYKVVAGRKHTFEKPKEHPTVVVREGKIPGRQRRSRKYIIKKQESIFSTPDAVFIEGENRGVKIGLAISKVGGRVVAYHPLAASPHFYNDFRA